MDYNTYHRDDSEYSGDEVYVIGLETVGHVVYRPKYICKWWEN